MLTRGDGESSRIPVSPCDASLWLCKGMSAACRVPGAESALRRSRGRGPSSPSAPPSASPSSAPAPPSAAAAALLTALWSLSWNLPSRQHSRPPSSQARHRAFPPARTTHFLCRARHDAHPCEASSSPGKLPSTRAKGGGRGAFPSLARVAEGCKRARRKVGCRALHWSGRDSSAAASWEPQAAGVRCTRGRAGY
ncbi:hypothetical protein VFPFJ_11233 [Purpureocillium lilacinum]|uniref:Uncharacterized protein n=1 Tax=Purpureocillium lilacinum TaxID=33203 RepID=A0A179FK35_PURLI|nr:hypothetical protein VFPFJ_11233 [Purpureocillium lilacinum]OAQ65698.1 hypothetical protein VFPFJ_11233 [Purpureocillium lilacinum]OAQ78236.1 hypothetical protein VFPBJ_06355 [Purpureocillium lilacinum]